MGLFLFLVQFFVLQFLSVINGATNHDTTPNHELNESFKTICPRIVNDNCTKLKAPTSLQNHTSNKTDLNNDTKTAESKQILTTGFSKLELEKHSKSVIFVLGNTGSGKTTMTQTVNGNLSQLHAVLTHAGKLVVIDDNDRIGLPTTTSKTLVPEYLVNPENNVSFYDCPGFDDNRGAELDIAAMYYINSITENIKEAKFLFTVTQSSVTSGYDRNDFRLLASHASRFLLNMKKFSDSIGLIVTKVDNFSDFGVCLNDTQVVENIVEFLKKLKVTMSRRLPEEHVETRALHQREIEFVEAILKKDGNGEYSKIWFLRNPPQCGPFSKMPYMWEVRKKITNLYTTKLVYSPTTPDDFGFTLKDETVLKIKDFYVPEIKSKMEKNLTELIDDRLNSSEDDFTSKFTSEYEMKDAIVKIIAILNRLDTVSSTFGQNETFLQSHKALLEAMGQSATPSYLLEIEKDEDVLTFYERVTMTSITRPSIHPLRLKAKVRFQNLKVKAMLNIQDTIAPQIVSEIKNITAHALIELMQNYQASFTQEFTSQHGMKEAMHQIKTISTNLTKFVEMKLSNHFHLEDIPALFTIFQTNIPASYLNKTAELENLRRFYENATLMVFERPALDSLILTLQNDIQNIRENSVIYIRDVATPKLISSMLGNVSNIIAVAITDFESIFEKEMHRNNLDMEALANLNTFEQQLREFSLAETQDQSFTNEIQGLLNVIKMSIPEEHLEVLKKHDQVLSMYEKFTKIKVLKPSLKPSVSKLSEVIANMKKKIRDHTANSAIPAIFSQIEEIVLSLTHSVENQYLEDFYDNLSRDTLSSKISKYLQNFDEALSLEEKWEKRESAEYSSETSVVTILTELEDIYSSLGYSIPSEQTEGIEMLEKRLTEYGIVLGTPIKRPLGNWLKNLLKLVDNLGEKLELYGFFDMVIKKLQTYEVQSAIEKIGSVKTSSFSTALLFINKVCPEIFTLKIEKYMEEKANQKDKQHLSEIAKIAIPIPMTFQCLENGQKVVVEGNNVFMKNIFPKAMSKCKQNSLKELEIFATEAIYFDADVVAMGSGLILRVLAKKWEVIGTKRAIKLTGVDAKHQTGVAAPCGAGGENGNDGKPGIPGGHGGSFYGIYDSITNGQAMTIDVSLGAGGNAQDGSNGCRGRDGRDATRSDFPSIGQYEAQKHRFAVIGYYKDNWRGDSWQWHVLEGEQGQKEMVEALGKVDTAAIFQ